MVHIPTVFGGDDFPEINDIAEFRGHRYVFFEQFTLPTPTQLQALREDAPGWALITWGWWDGQADIADMDIEGIAFESDSLDDLGELDPAAQLDIFALGTDGRSSGNRGPQPITQAEDRAKVYPEGLNYGLVAVECPAWMTVAVCEWRGSENVAEPGSLAVVLQVWQEHWGVEVISFGAEEGESELLVRVPQDPQNLDEMLIAMAVASDGVTVYRDKNLGLLIQLWWD